MLLVTANLWFLAASLWQVAAVPPPVAQESADCTHPVYATDTLVCEDPALLALDRRLVAVLANAPAQTAPGGFIEDQGAWFRRSRLCAFRADHPACAAQAYLDRIAVLSMLTSPLPVTIGSCLHGETVAVAAEDHLVLVLARGGQAMAVATRAGGAWRPFVSYRRSGRSITFRNLGGEVIARCIAMRKS